MSVAMVAAALLDEVGLVNTEKVKLLLRARLPFLRFFPKERYFPSQCILFNFEFTHHKRRFLSRTLHFFRFISRLLVDQYSLLDHHGSCKLKQASKVHNKLDYSLSTCCSF